jgi:mannosyltransferase OCH1-like enzyme
MIPRTLWRIWLDEPVPPEYDAYWERFAELNPGWQLKTISRSVLPWMRPHIRDIFRECSTHAGRSDVLRYELLYQFGGVYVDCDVEPLKPFEPLLGEGKGFQPFAGWEDNRMICPTVMGSPPSHPAMGDLLDFLPGWFEVHRGEAPNRQTGPYVLTRCWRWRDDVTLYAPDVFYPVGWWEKKKLGGPYPETALSVHHWDARWLPGGPPQRDT